MTNICPNSGCDALYDLTEADVGRSFPCRKCGAMLLVEEGGLRMLSRRAERVPPAEAPPPRQTAEPRPAPSPRENDPMRPLTQTAAVTNILFSVLFGVGTCFAVLFLFLPLLDVTRESAKRAAIEAGDQRIRRLYNSDAATEPDFPVRPPFGQPGDKDKANDKDKSGGPTDAEKKAQKDDWEKRKKDLQQEVDDTRTYSRQAMNVYTWGMLFGFLCLAVASVGFLSPSQTTTRRVLGVIVLSALVVFIFMYCMFAFIGTTVRGVYF